MVIEEALFDVATAAQDLLQMDRGHETSKQNNNEFILSLLGPYIHS